MGHSNWMLGVGGLLLFAMCGHAQESTQFSAEARFGDGSLVRLSLPHNAIEVQTRFGKLNVPIAEIRRIEFGLHIPPELSGQIQQSLKQLGSDVYKDRELASKGLLQVGHWAYPSLQRASRSPDLEVAQRAAGVLKQMSEKLPNDLLKIKEDDVIHTSDFTIVGRITQPTLKAHNPYFGEVSVKVCDLRVLTIRHRNSSEEFVVDASKHGSSLDQWLDTGVVVDSSSRMVLQSDGQVDLWPQGPGQYMATPKGFNTAGRGGQFQAGALVAKIGEQGKPFLVGERFDSVVAEEGRLFFQIIPSPWNNASSGTYRVRMGNDRVAVSQR